MSTKRKMSVEAIAAVETPTPGALEASARTFYGTQARKLAAYRRAFAFPVPDTVENVIVTEALEAQAAAKRAFMEQLLAQAPDLPAHEASVEAVKTALAAKQKVSPAVGTFRGGSDGFNGMLRASLCPARCQNILDLNFRGYGLSSQALAPNGNLMGIAEPDARFDPVPGATVVRRPVLQALDQLLTAGVKFDMIVIDLRDTSAAIDLHGRWVPPPALNPRNAPRLLLRENARPRPKPTGNRYQILEDALPYLMAADGEVLWALPRSYVYPAGAWWVCEPRGYDAFRNATLAFVRRTEDSARWGDGRPPSPSLPGSATRLTNAWGWSPRTGTLGKFRRALGG